MEDTMNHVILIGNLGRDPIARGSERNIASFSLAVEHTHPDSLTDFIVRDALHSLPRHARNRFS